MSESDAAGKLTRIPGIVEAEAIKPIQPNGVFRYDAKSGKTGLLDIVELKIAKNPIIQSIRKMLCFAFFACKPIDEPARNVSPNLILYWLKYYLQRLATRLELNIRQQTSKHRKKATIFRGFQGKTTKKSKKSNR